MRIGIPAEHETDETRVAVTPAVAKKLIAMGVEVLAERGAGVAAGEPDQAYEQAGVKLTAWRDDSPSDVWHDADLIFTVTAPTLEQAQSMKSGAVLVGMLDPFNHPSLIEALAQQQVTAFSLELLPRITRAQAMDVLSSQANLAGYKAALLAADACPKLFPMMITAAGTLTPAKVFVLGAGVAGLQAIATAKRLGANVEAYDIRAATKEQVLSLGARFVELPSTAQEDQDTGGYAREQTEQQRQQQTELMAKHVTAADAVITTAAVPGKPPPMLIPKGLVQQMKPNSVLMDMAAQRQAGRGNCELTEPGQVIQTDNGVTVIGTMNLPAKLPIHASQAYANNMHAFVGLLLSEGQLKMDFEDPILKATALTHGGEIVNEKLVEPATRG